MNRYQKKHLEQRQGSKNAKNVINEELSLAFSTRKCRRQGKKGSLEKVSTDLECQTSEWIIFYR